MKRRHATLTLASGEKLLLTNAGCTQCHRMVGCVNHEGQLRIFDALGFDQQGLIRFSDHACPAEVVASTVRELSDALAVPGPQ
jgi:hypothetical protein